MRSGYVEFVIGSLTKAGLRVSVARKHKSPDDEANHMRKWLMMAGADGPDARIILADRFTGARYVVSPKKVVAIIVHGGDADG